MKRKIIKIILFLLCFITCSTVYNGARFYENGSVGCAEHLMKSEVHDSCIVIDDSTVICGDGWLWKILH